MRRWSCLSGAERSAAGVTREWLVALVATVSSFARVPPLPSNSRRSAQLHQWWADAARAHADLLNECATGAEALLPLSPRQRQVARLLCAGQTNKEMASGLGLSVRTVDMHVAHLLARLDCHTRTEAAGRLLSLLAR